MRVKLLKLAHARSGDKGDTANVGLIALREEFYPLLAREVTAERVREQHDHHEPQRVHADGWSTRASCRERRPRRIRASAWRARDAVSSPPRDVPTDPG